MRRGRIFLLLLVLIVLGALVVFVFMRGFITPQTEASPTPIPPTPTPDMVQIVIANQQIARGDILTLDDVSVAPYPRQQYLSDQMFTDISTVIDMRATMDVPQGAPIVRGMLSKPAVSAGATGSDWALEIPRGMVAVSIPISRLSSVSYAPRPGDHVNVIVTMLFIELDTEFQSRLPNVSAQVLGPMVSESETTLAARASSPDTPIGRGELDLAFEQIFYSIPSEPQRARMVSQSLIQDVIVLYMGTFPLEAEEKAAEAVAAAARGETMIINGTEVPIATPTPYDDTGNQPAPTPTPTPPPPDVITLIVSPQDAVSLNYLIFSGAQLTLALRPAQDDTKVFTEAVTLQYLLDQYSIPIPVKLPYGMEPSVNDLIAPPLPNDILPLPAP